MQRFFFHPDLPWTINKHSVVPLLTKQMAPDLINNIPENSLQVYTDDSKDDRDRAGSGVFMKDLSNDTKIKLKNPDTWSVFRQNF